MVNSGVYKIRNIINGKCYIGSTSSIDIRWRKHKSELSKGTHCNKKLLRAWNKYGACCFVFEIIENCKGTDLIKREQYYLDTLKPEYNICKLAYSTRGIKRTAEQNRTNSESKTGHVVSTQTRQKIREKLMGRKNGPRSEETKKKISIAQKGKKRHHKRREGRSASRVMKGQNNPMSRTNRDLRAAKKAEDFNEK